MSKASQARAFKERVKELPRLPMGDPSLKKERVEAAKETLLDVYGREPRTADLVSRYMELRDEKAKAEEVVKDINVDLDAVQELIANQFEAEGVEALRTTEGLLSMYVEPYTSVEDHDALREWCIKQGLERSLQLPWQTVNSLTKQLLEDGKPEPDGVTIFAKTKFRLARS